MAWTINTKSKASSTDNFTIADTASSTDNFSIDIPSLANEISDSFISTWTTTTANEVIALPLVSDGSYNFTVDWGDGNSATITAYNDSGVSNTFLEAGTYTVTIVGTIQGFKFGNGGNKTNISTITNWGNLDISTSEAFYGCSNLDVTAEDAPIISTTNMRFGFAGCTALTGIGNASTWDVSSVTNIEHLFNSCTNFNADVGDWDVGEVTSLASTFVSCAAFNQDIGSWDVAKVETMAEMFSGATIFNQDLGGWDTGEVTSMAYTFLNTAMDQDLSDWDIAKVTTMSTMFHNTTMSTANYDALLIGWEAQTEQPNVTFHAGNADPSASGITARNALVANGWTIVDADGTHT